MGHKDDGKKTFGPGHQGWYNVRYLDEHGDKDVVPRKGSSAFEAAAAAGKSLSECTVTPITCPECIFELDTGTGSPDPHQCHEEDQ